MAAKSGTDTIYRFSWHHYHLQGKMLNIQDAFEHQDADQAALSLTEPPLDDARLDNPTITSRLTRIEKAVRELKKEKFKLSLILPGLNDESVKDAEYKNYVKTIYTTAASTSAKIIWIDDSLSSKPRSESRKDLLGWYKSLQKIIEKNNPRIRMGLIAGPQHLYDMTDVTVTDIAKEICGKHKPLIAVNQNYKNDYNRLAIIDSISAMAITQAQCDDKKKTEFVGTQTMAIMSTFNKSTEADQIQATLNTLYGCRTGLVDLADRIGTSVGIENAYMKAADKRKRYFKKLTEYLPTNVYPEGIRIVIPDGNRPITNPTDESGHVTWAKILWRMGLPVSFITTAVINPKDKTNVPYILTGNTPYQLSHEQFDHIFNNGALLDASAAKTIDQMGLPGLLGMRVGGPVDEVHTEIFSDQTFAPQHYGYNMVLPPCFVKKDTVELKPFHINTRMLTTFLQKDKSPTLPAIMAFDNIEHDHRSIVLPYTIHKDNVAAFMTHQRMKHLQGCLTWLLRKRLPFMVENTPDLIPFMVTNKKEKRIVLALLNVGFDWAIDARIRFGTLPFPVKRVKELDEQGKLLTEGSLKFHSDRDYHYIQLDADTAVPPMQISTFILEG